MTRQQGGGRNKDGGNGGRVAGSGSGRWRERRRSVETGRSERGEKRWRRRKG